MILKHFDLKKIDLNFNNFILLYGKNEGLKKESIKVILKDFSKTLHYEENEILENSNVFLENFLSKSLFEERKIIIIRRATDKILKILEQIEPKKSNDIIIVNAGILEKKSKLRTYFEKDKKYICIAFYPDTTQTLTNLSINFFQERKILISQSNINLIINKCNNDRETLINELEKIYLFSNNGKKLSSENISKLINITENHSVSELVDNCLAKNEKKTINILNENNFTNEDCILITRVFLNKAKKIHKLSTEFEKNKNIDLTISSAKPPIFWKDKEITRMQIYKWKPDNIKKLIYKLTDFELIIKKNLNNSINLMTDFLLEQSSIKTNNKI